MKLRLSDRFQKMFCLACLALLWPGKTSYQSLHEKCSYFSYILSKKLSVILLKISNSCIVVPTKVIQVTVNVA